MPQARAAQNRLSAIFLMIAAVTVFSVLDSTAKHLGQSLPVAVIVACRYGFGTLIALGIAIRMVGTSAFRTGHPVLQVLRGLMLAISTGANFAALHWLQLAQTAAINFSGPLWVCVLSPLLLKEKTGLGRWLAVVAGFAGVLIIVRPGTSGFHPAMLLSILSALAGALYNLVTRRVGGRDRAETSLVYVSAFGFLFAAPVAGFGWDMPHGWEWLWLASLGLSGGLGHYMLIEAHRRAPAPVLAPFGYAQILSMTVIGLVVFGDVPDWQTVAGALLVAAAGIAVFEAERRSLKFSPAA